MIEKTTDNLEDMWNAFHVSDLLLTTANSTMNTRTNALVMGAGHAKQVRDRFPGVDVALMQPIKERVKARIDNGRWQDNAYYVTNDGKYEVWGDYFLIVSPEWPKKKLGIFQVKRHFGLNGRKNEAARDLMLSIIGESVRWLQYFCRMQPRARVDMPFPGIGNGGMDIDLVREEVKRLPDNVYTWRLEL